MSISHAVILLAILGGIGVKAELHVYLEDIFFEYLNPEYYDVENSEIYLVESSSSENIIGTNVTLIKELSPGTKGHLKLLGLSEGEYNHPTGLNITLDLCDMVADPFIFRQFFEAFGITRENCPPKPGTYTHEGLHLTIGNVPVFFPESKYLSIFELLFEGQLLMVIHTIVDVRM